MQLLSDMADNILRALVVNHLVHRWGKHVRGILWHTHGSDRPVFRIARDVLAIVFKSRMHGIGGLQLQC